MYPRDRKGLDGMELKCARVTDLLLRAKRLEREGHADTAEAIRQRAVDLLVDMERPGLQPRLPDPRSGQAHFPPLR